jgi:tRNA-modifying protein YgfZ
MTESMNPWLQFLARHGAQLDDAQQVAGFEDSRVQGDLPPGFVAPLTDLGLIAATGDDAASFLHNQLTNDVEHIVPEEARLAGYCSPKGRLLATFLMWKTADAILLQLPRQIQPAVQKRLQMYILRLKAKLADATESHVALGLGGQAAAQFLQQQWFPTLPAAPFAKCDSAAGTLIRLADALGQPRFQWIASPETAQQAWPELAKALAPVGTSLWRLTDIHAGMPQVIQATQEQFVPQMVNFELIGGVNFKKGCYPGQEIVARSQYLGKLKRRMLPVSLDGDAAAGMEVFSSADPEQPCGMVVNAEPNLKGGSDALVELKIAATEDGTIHLGSAQGPVLHFGNLPYPLPA